MIQENYSASCFVEYNEGEYHIECDICTDGNDAYAEYTGTNFVDGINDVIDSLTKEFDALEKENTPEMSQEEHIEYLEDLVLNLREENIRLANELNQCRINNKAIKENNNHLKDVENNKYISDLFDKIIKELYQ